MCDEGQMQEEHRNVLASAAGCWTKENVLQQSKNFPNDPATDMQMLWLLHKIGHEETGRHKRWVLYDHTNAKIRNLTGKLIKYCNNTKKHFLWPLPADAVLAFVSTSFRRAKGKSTDTD